MLIPSLHRDRSVWGADADDFNPDHFSPENKQIIPSNAHRLFGFGMRSCIGRQFAPQEATLVLGMLLQRFEFVDHCNHQLHTKTTLTVKPDEFYIKIRLSADRNLVHREKAAAEATPAAEPMAGTRLSITLVREPFRPPADPGIGMIMIGRRDRAGAVSPDSCRNGPIFVCGNARTLAPGVRAALTQIAASKTGRSADECQNWPELALLAAVNLLLIAVLLPAGWKGGHFYPMLFVAAAAGLCISQFVGGLGPVVAVSAGVLTWCSGGWWQRPSWCC